MPLTPADVSNKQFRIAFRGYSLDEVDTFLDEVESEIGRLLRENDALRQGGAAGAGSSAPVPTVGAKGEPDPPPLRPGEGQEAALRTLLLAQRTADEVVAEARAEAEQIVTSARQSVEGIVAAAEQDAERTTAAAREQADALLLSAREEADATLTAARTEADTTLTAAREEAGSTLAAARTEAESTLTAAREEAEATLTAAREEAGSTLAAARTEAETTLTAARTEAETTLTSAREQADTVLTSARTEADSALSTARAAAAQLEAETSERTSAALGDLERTRRSLEVQVEDLRTFEREYRSRLRAHLQDSLAELDGRSAETAPVAVASEG